MQIAGLGGGIAGDIDDFGRSQLEEEVHYVLVHAGAGRVGDDEIGFSVPFGKCFAEHFAHVSGVERAVLNLIDAGIFDGVCDGVGDFFDADDFFGGAGHVERDAADACVEVIYRLAAV